MRFLLPITGLFLLLVSVLCAADENPFRVFPVEKEIEIVANQTETSISAKLTVPPQHYLYAANTHLEVDLPEGISVSEVSRPPVSQHQDQFKKANIEIFQGSDTAEKKLTFRLVLSIDDRAFAQKKSWYLPVKLHYQGCSPKVCYLPMEKEWRVRIVAAAATAKASNDGSEGWDFFQISQRGLILALIFAFIGGLLSSLTPCVYPMIPITVAVIGAKEQTSKLQSLKLGVLFALGIAITYATLGLFAASTGRLLGTALQNQFVIIFVATVFTTMGLGMIGYFEIRLPALLRSKLGKINTSQGMLGVLFTGLVTGIVAAPCVGPVILGILSYVAALQRPITGFALLFFFALGLSTPFVLIGVFSSWLGRLPKSGMWLDRFKKIFGLLLIATGIYFLKSIFAREVFLVLVLISLIVLGWLCRLHLWFGRQGSVIVFSFALVSAGALLFGSIIPREPHGEDSHHEDHKEFFVWQSDLDKSFVLAKNKNKPLMIDFFAEWCAACHELDKHVFRSPAVGHIIDERFIAVKLDVTRLDSASADILNRYQVLALPAILFFDSNGQQLPDYRINGFIPAEEMKFRLNKLLENLN